jgi:hypothetical protein
MQRNPSLESISNGRSAPGPAHQGERIDRATAPISINCQQSTINQFPLNSQLVEWASSALRADLSQDGRRIWLTQTTLWKILLKEYGRLA